MYNDEICRLQQTELSLDDLDAEDSLYIQEHKLKRKVRLELHVQAAAAGCAEATRISLSFFFVQMMKIYEKLCELKGCNTLTGRVIEQKIPYTSTRYPEINKKVSVLRGIYMWLSQTPDRLSLSSQIERFINSPEAHRNPPDYQDIHKLVLRTNERYNLCLSKKLLAQIAQEAFRETVGRLQERRHFDLVYNFGSHLTDSYKPGKIWTGAKR